MTANTDKLAMTFNDETGIHIKYTTLKISEIIAEDKELAIKIRTNETAVNIKDIAIRNVELARHIKEVQSKNPGIVNRYMKSQQKSYIPQ